ncbi:hypothetical protein GYMLUDRAFT_62722 [Collybiopsis luxurians FD-317 M1]|uniref:Uncharacterized protein n=1 Tax=Collybiopsis luxurians FD-317 M1 TaxID=944289 RepID=A0A0D0CJE7_9AGAR|nr:hypothetical protein GYMLUDRAFT_62722 [Collybiopsis luxurians FD-317 M1]
MGQDYVEDFGAVKVQTCGTAACSGPEEEQLIVHHWPGAETFHLMVEFAEWLYSCRLPAKMQETIHKLVEFKEISPGHDNDGDILDDLLLKLGELRNYEDPIEITDDSTDAGDEEDIQGPVPNLSHSSVQASSSGTQTSSSSTQSSSSSTTHSSVANVYPRWVIDQIVTACTIVGEAALDVRMRDPEVLERMRQLRTVLPPE